MVILLLKSAPVGEMQTSARCRWSTAAKARSTVHSLSLWLVSQGVLLFSSCLERNLPHMFQLWSDIFNRCVSNLQPLAPSYPKLTVQTVTQVNIDLAAPTLRTRSDSEFW